MYYPEGSLFSETNLFSGHSGFYRTFHKNGTLAEEKCYDAVSVAKEHAWEETSDRAWGENGNPLVREGLIKTYYANGALNEETEYKNDKKNGRQRVYYYNGKTIVAERYFLENKRVGIHTTYDGSGHLVQEEDWGYPTWYTEQLRTTISSLQNENARKDITIRYLYVTVSIFLFLGFILICITFFRKYNKTNPLLPQ